MNLEITEDRPSSLSAYASVPSRLLVRDVLELTTSEGPLAETRLVRRALDVAYEKDYDAIPGQHPSSWPGRFDLDRWGFLTASFDGVTAGRAAIAPPGSDVHSLAVRADAAVLWDIRVAPTLQRRGVGAALFQAACDWAAERGAGCIVIETQNVNVPACLFYSAQGCVLAAIQPFAYPEFPDETQLLWLRPL